jgi:hypothetical protein
MLAGVQGLLVGGLPSVARRTQDLKVGRSVGIADQPQLRTHDVVDVERERREALEAVGADAA